MKFHKFAGIYPLLDDDKLQELADDIRKNGLAEPIVVFEDAILDGRNRMTACTLAQVQPTYRHFSGDRAAALAFVQSSNYHRRHLDSRQRAASWKLFELENEAIAAEVAAIREAAAERNGGRPKAGEKPTQEIASVSRDDRTTNAARAKMAGTNRQYIREVDEIAAVDKSILVDVAHGKKTMEQAKAEIGKATKKRHETNENWSDGFKKTERRSKGVQEIIERAESLRDYLSRPAREVSVLEARVQVDGLLDQLKKL